jgi:arylsulfatase A-like enzyme
MNNFKNNIVIGKLSYNEDKMTDFSNSTEKKRRQNILVILCDQLRKDFLSAYGCRAVPTPNLDSLCRRGVVFENAITQSTVCAPARACMMTGRYVSDHGVWTNDIPFRDGMEYLPSRMVEEGYASGCFGKLHHYPALDTKGFQKAVLFEENRLGESEPYLQWLKKNNPKAKSVFAESKEFSSEYPDEQHYESWLADECRSWIADHRRANASQPFFAWLSFQGPHTPYDPPHEYRGVVDKKLLPPVLKTSTDAIPEVARFRRAICPPPGRDAAEFDRIREAYAEKIAHIDKKIGLVLERLTELGELENTTIIFSADHGDLLGDHGQNQKGPFPYRSQLEIPLIVSGDPRLPAGNRCAALCGNIDIPATVLAAAGASRGLGYSRSLFELCEPGSKSLRATMFSEFCDECKTVEDSQYRLSYFPFTGFIQMFDKKNDPAEQHDLGREPAMAATIARLLTQIIDHQLLAKSPRQESYDLVPGTQLGLTEKNPRWRDEFAVAWPIWRLPGVSNRLAAAGLDTTYNDFSRKKTE